MAPLFASKFSLGLFFWCIENLCVLARLATSILEHSTPCKAIQKLLFCQIWVSSIRRERCLCGIQLLSKLGTASSMAESD